LKILISKYLEQAKETRGFFLGCGGSDIKLCFLNIGIGTTEIQIMDLNEI